MVFSGRILPLRVFQGMIFSARFFPDWIIKGRTIRARFFPGWTFPSEISLRSIEGATDPHDGTRLGMLLKGALVCFFSLLTGINPAASQNGHPQADVLADQEGRGVIRCLTPHIIEHNATDGAKHPEIRNLAVATGKSAEEVEISSGEHIYLSKSGKFRLIYKTEGRDSVWTQENSAWTKGTGIGEPGVPDYIALAAHYADSSYRHQVEQLGYTDPLSTTRCGQQSGTPIDIRFGDLRFGANKVYGYFSPPGRLYINSTFSDPVFQNNDDEDKIIGALKVTIAHELKHAIQYASYCFSGNEINVHWLEMDATMMENVVFPNVNDYYNYIGGTAGIFGNPQTRFPRAYSHVTFMLYYHEDIGGDFWVDVWDVIGEEYQSGYNIPMLEAMNRVLHDRSIHGKKYAYGEKGASGEKVANGKMSTYGEKVANGNTNAQIDPWGGMASEQAVPDLEASLLRNYLWHLASGNRSLTDYGFSERWNYPDASLFGSFDAIPEWPHGVATLASHSARFFEFRANEMDVSGDVALALFNSGHPPGIGFLGKKKSGEVVEFLVSSGAGMEEETNRQKYIFPVSWQELDWLGLAVMNTRAASPLNRMQLLAGEGPSIERFWYGDIAKTGELKEEDGRLILQNLLTPSSISAFDHFLGDVSGNGVVTHYDASRVFMNLTDGSPFPVDHNLNGKGPEWSRFIQVEKDIGPVFASTRNSRHHEAESISVHPFSRKSAPYNSEKQDSLTASLRVIEQQVLAGREMELVLSLKGTTEESFREWKSLYLDLQVTFPPNVGETGPGDPITLEMLDIDPASQEEALSGWEYDLTESRLRLVFASSAPLASQVSTGDDTDLLSLRIIPGDEGNLHFRIAAIQLDERDYFFDLPGMDTIRVMGPVFADLIGEETNHPKKLKLDQNYPNPFNPVTTIRFSMPYEGPVSLEVFDKLGRRAAVLVDGVVPAGEHSVSFDASSLSSGVYLYRLRMDGQSEVRKMTLTK